MLKLLSLSSQPHSLTHTHSLSPSPSLNTSCSPVSLTELSSPSLSSYPRSISPLSPRLIHPLLCPSLILISPLSSPPPFPLKPHPPSPASLAPPVASPTLHPRFSLPRLSLVSRWPITAPNSDITFTQQCIINRPRLPGRGQSPFFVRLVPERLAEPRCDAPPYAAPPGRPTGTRKSPLVTGGSLVSAAPSVSPSVPPSWSLSVGDLYYARRGGSFNFKSSSGKGLIKLLKIVLELSVSFLSFPFQCFASFVPAILLTCISFFFWFLHLSSS